MRFNDRSTRAAKMGQSIFLRLRCCQREMLGSKNKLLEVAFLHEATPRGRIVISVSGSVFHPWRNSPPQNPFSFWQLNPLPHFCRLVEVF
jgi:hypothetical protein